MSTTLEEAIAEVFAAHDWRWSTRDSRTGDGVRIACTAYPCGWYAERETDEDDVWTSHRDHVAAEVGSVVRGFYAELTDEKAAMADVAAWLADALGYPIDVVLPDHPVPQPLWDALVEHIHADESGKWHGNTLDLEDTESWLADEAGRDR